MKKLTFIALLFIVLIAASNKGNFVPLPTTLPASADYRSFIRSADSSLPTFTNTAAKKKNAVVTKTIFTVADALKSNTAIKGVLGVTKGLRLMEVYFFPGTSDKRALIIGGVHGSELSSIEVVRSVIKNLMEGEKPYYNVILIPSLFPDNAALAEKSNADIGSTNNIGRYTDSNAADPNRQMPALGKAFNYQNPVDFAGRSIETENQLLLHLIQQFKPQRVANVHAIRDTSHAGIFADPRTDCKGIANGFDTDSSLAVAMAQFIVEKGGHAGGNNLDVQPSCLYHNDPAVAKQGEPQSRNLNGSTLSNNRGHGVSLGGWASTAVCDEELHLYNRNAMRLLTIEFPGYKRPTDYVNLKSKETAQHNIASYANAITQVFLGAHFVE